MIHTSDPTERTVSMLPEGVPRERTVSTLPEGVLSSSSDPGYNDTELYI